MNIDTFIKKSIDYVVYSNIIPYMISKIAYVAYVAKVAGLVMG